MRWATRALAVLPLLTAAAVAWTSITLAQGWIVDARTSRPADPDALQVAAMAALASTNATRTLPDAQLRDVRVDFNGNATYFFGFQGADPSRELYATIRVVNGQQLAGGGGSSGLRGGTGTIISAVGTDTPMSAGVLDLTKLRVGPGAAAQAAEATWPGCKAAYLLLSGVGEDLRWTAYCTLPDRRVGWGYVDNTDGVLASQPLPPLLPAMPARLSEQPPSNAPVDTGCLGGAATAIPSVANMSQADAENTVNRSRLGQSRVLFTDGVPQPRLGVLLRAQPVSFTSPSQNVAAWLLVYEWLPSNPADRSTHYYALVGGQSGSAGYGTCAA